MEKRFARAGARDTGARAEIACTTTRESSCNARLARRNAEYLIGISDETSSPLLPRSPGNGAARAIFVGALCAVLR